MQKVYQTIYDAESRGYLPLTSLGVGESILGIPRREGPNVPLYDTKSSPGQRLTRHARTWLLSDEHGALNAVLVTERLAEELARHVERERMVRITRIGSPGHHQIEEL